MACPKAIRVRELGCPVWTGKSRVGRLRLGLEKGRAGRGGAGRESQLQAPLRSLLYEKRSSRPQTARDEQQEPRQQGPLKAAQGPPVHSK